MTNNVTVAVMTFGAFLAFVLAFLRRLHKAGWDFKALGQEDLMYSVLVLVVSLNLSMFSGVATSIAKSQETLEVATALEEQSSQHDVDEKLDQIENLIKTTEHSLVSLCDAEVSEVSGKAQRLLDLLDFPVAMLKYDENPDDTVVCYQNEYYRTTSQLEASVRDFDDIIAFSALMTVREEDMEAQYKEWHRALDFITRLHPARVRHNDPVSAQSHLMRLHNEGGKTEPAIGYLRPRARRFSPAGSQDIYYLFFLDFYTLGDIEELTQQALDDGVLECGGGQVAVQEQALQGLLEDNRFSMRYEQAIVELREGTVQQLYRDQVSAPELAPDSSTAGPSAPDEEALDD